MKNRIYKLTCGCIIEIVKVKNKQSRKFRSVCFKHAYNREGARR